MSPLDFLISTFRNENVDLPMRLEAARAAAPFVHPRLSVVDAKVVAEANVTPQLNDEERRQRARQMILEAFAEPKQPQTVIAGKPMLRVIEHEPAADEAKSEGSEERSG